MDLPVVSARWLLILAMIGGADAYAQNAPANRPEVRTSRIAPAAQWPRACAFIALEDVEQVFSGKTVRPQDRSGELDVFMQMLTMAAPQEADPRYCNFWVTWSQTIDGQQTSSLASAGLTIEHMVESLDVAHKYYDYARIDGGADAEIAGLGDEASISPANELYLRKGLLTVRITVPAAAAGDPGRAEARRWATELARRVAARMP